MKTLKVLSVALLSFFAFACENEDNNTGEQPKEGYVEYIATPDENGNVEFEIGAQKINVDWGDGTLEEFVPEEEMALLSHQYSNQDAKTVIITAKKLVTFRKVNPFYNPLGLPIHDPYAVTTDELHFGNCPDLKSIQCYASGLGVLEIAKADSLQFLDCSYNSLISLDLTKLTSLQFLLCYSNNLTDLNLQENQELIGLICGNNQFENLAVNNHKSLEYCFTDRNAIMYESGGSFNYSYSNGGNYGFGFYINLRSSTQNSDDIIPPYEDTSKNPPLTKINFAGCEALLWFSCNNNILTEVNLQGCNALNYVSCNYNNLSTESLNAIFGYLPEGKENAEEIEIKGNAGTDDCDTAIAKSKGWVVTK